MIILGGKYNSYCGGLLGLFVCMLPACFSYSLASDNDAEELVNGLQLASERLSESVTSEPSVLAFEHADEGAFLASLISAIDSLEGTRSETSLFDGHLEYTFVEKNEYSDSDAHQVTGNTVSGASFAATVRQPTLPNHATEHCTEVSVDLPGRDKKWTREFCFDRTARRVLGVVTGAAVIALAWAAMSRGSFTIPAALQGSFFSAMDAPGSEFTITPSLSTREQLRAAIEARPDIPTVPRAAFVSGGRYDPNPALDITVFPTVHRREVIDRDIDTIVIHAMSGIHVNPERAYDPALNRKILDHYEISTHYMIDRDGNISQLVKEHDRARHAGGALMPDPDGRTRINDFSLGVHLLGRLEDDYTDAQYQSLSKLLKDIKSRHGVQNENILPWEQLASERAVELGLRKRAQRTPGPRFDWDRLRADLN